MTLKKLASLSLILAITSSALVGCTTNANDITSFRGGSLTASELQKELNLNRIMYYSSNNTDMPAEQLKSDAEHYASSLARTDILALAGEKAKLSVSEAEIEEAMSNIESILEENKDLKSAIEMAGFTEEDINESIKKNLIANKYYNSIANDVAISENKVLNYYNEHKDSDYTLKYADAAHILIKTVDDERNPLSDEEIANAKKKAEEVLAKVKAGEDFATLAKEYSEDTTASNGGELGKFYEDQMVKEFEEAAFALKEGQTSEIVKTVYGYHIIKLNSKGVETLDYDTISSTVAYDLYNSLIEDVIVSLENKYNMSVNNKNVEELLKNITPISSLIKESSSEEDSNDKEDTNSKEKTTSKEDTNNKSSETNIKSE